jgi:hypothetical protein
VQGVSARRTCPQDVAGELPVPRAGLDHDERIGAAELFPTAVERASDAGSEQRTDLGTGHEVAPGAAGTAPRREEADAGLVQRDVDEPVEGDRAFAPDEARDGVGGRTG